MKTYPVLNTVPRHDCCYMTLLSIGPKDKNGRS